MENPISTNKETCSICGLCEQVCPVRLIKKDSEAGISFRPDRLPFCIKCGQCMAVRPSQSIVVDGLEYARDFFALPAGPAVEMPFLEMIRTRRAVRVFKEQPVPKELLQRVVQAITFAPPSFPPLKTEIVVVEDTAVIRQALPEMIKVYDGLVKAIDHPVARFFVRRKVGAVKFKTSEYHVVPLMKSRLPELKEGVEDTITRYAPAMIVFHAHRDAENYEADIYIPDSNVVVASMILGYPKHRYQRGIKRELKSVTWI